MRRGRRGRLIAATIGVVLTLAAVAVVGYRAFAPQDMLIAPTTPYPTGGPVYDERPFSELRAAPLVVDGSLRVYAEKWRVWADGPVGARYEGTPYWSYRRWPAQAIGVISVSTVIGPVVVTHWSDGQVVAIDARKGIELWRVRVPGVEGGYDGRRTGASVVYEPATLLRAGDTVFVLGPGSVHAFAAGTGRARWSRTLPAGCQATAWTGPSVLVLTDCAAPALELVDPVTGATNATWPVPALFTPATPAGCQLGRSGCRLVTVGLETWLLTGSRLNEIAPLTPGALLAGDYVVELTAQGVQGRPLVGPGRVWTWYGKGRPIAADAAGVYLITEDMTMLGLNPKSGEMRVVGCAASLPGETWQPAHVQPAGDGRYVAVERVSTKAGPEGSDQEYFYGPRPVALVELYPPATLPVWPAKFAACRPL